MFNRILNGLGQTSFDTYYAFLVGLKDWATKSEHKVRILPILALLS